MCGIGGFNWRNEQLLARMSAKLAHRGPDDEGLFEDSHISLAHRRLSIIDVSERGHQPMMTNDGSLIMVYNGEVYNFRSLRLELEKEGYHFQSDTDSEVVLNAFHRYGHQCLSQFNGMFAFAIYDRKQRKVFLARDRLGIKPIYYYWDGSSFVFASEIKAILEHRAQRELNHDALAQFFTYRFNYGKQTVFRNIFKLLPGHFLSFDIEKKIIETEASWWDVDTVGVAESDASITEWADKLRELMTDAVSLRLISDVPLGFFLSGGLDSSIVTGVAGNLGARLETFSAGFERTNELPFAARASCHYGSEHHEVRIGDEALDLLEEMVYHMDEPIGDAAFLATYVLSREARRRVKVVLAGEGADELFAGYDRYKLALFGDMASVFVPGFLKRWMGGSGRWSENWRRLFAVMSGKNREARYLEVIRLFSQDEIRELALQAGETNDLKLREGDLLRAIQYFDLTTVLPNDFFMKADKMSSAWGLEERVPFLDHRVVELAFQLPRRAKLKGFDEKHVLKRAFTGIVPKDILKRRKHGFDVPMDYWMRGPLYHRLRSLLEENVHTVYDKKPVLSMLEAFRKTPDWSYKASFFTAQKLWSVLTFELWYRRFFT